MKHKLTKFFEYACLYSVYGIIFFIPISTAAIEIFFGLALIFFLLKITLANDFSFLKSNIYLVVFVFFIFCAFSLFNSGVYFDKSLNSLIFKWGEKLLIFIIVSQAMTTRRRIRNALFIILAVSFLVALDGLFQRVYLVDFLRHRNVLISAKKIFITASFKHYNSFGAYLSFVLTLAVSLLLSRPGKKVYSFLLVLLIILLGACLFWTLSRGSWLSFFVVLMLIAILTRKIEIIVPIITVFITIVFFFSSFYQRFVFTFGPSGDAGRFAIWRSALKMIRENPFLGKGLGTFMDYLPKYNPRLGAQYAHNSFLQIFAETGIFSLLSFLLFLWLLISTALKAFRKTHDYVLLGFLCGICGFLLHSFFDTHFYSLQLSTLFWAMAGILAALSSQQQQ